MRRAGLSVNSDAHNGAVRTDKFRSYVALSLFRGNPADRLSDSNYYTIADIQAAGGIIIGDKLFDYFSVVATATAGALAPNAAAISITPVQVNGDYGMKFNGGWSALAGQIVNSTIQFHASILPAYSGYLFEDNSLVAVHGPWKHSE
jgi:hypothetical protein